VKSVNVPIGTRKHAWRVELMNSESTHKQEARNALQLLENREMLDALSGLKFLRAFPYVDALDVAVVGHSFRGSLTVLLAEREPNR
jgi:dienelactone hydrolase